MTDHTDAPGLVAVLRNAANAFPNIPEVRQYDPLLREAAAEIERLRKVERAADYLLTVLPNLTSTAAPAPGTKGALIAALVETRTAMEDLRAALGSPDPTSDQRSVATARRMVLRAQHDDGEHMGGAAQGCPLCEAITEAFLSTPNARSEDQE